MSPACALRTSTQGPSAPPTGARGLPPSSGASEGAGRGPGGGVSGTARSSPAVEPVMRCRGGATRAGSAAWAGCRRGTGSPAAASAAALGPGNGRSAGGPGTAGNGTALLIAVGGPAGGGPERGPAEAGSWPRRPGPGVVSPVVDGPVATGAPVSTVPVPPRPGRARRSTGGSGRPRPIGAASLRSRRGERIVRVMSPVLPRERVGPDAERSVMTRLGTTLFRAIVGQSACHSLG